MADFIDIFGEDFSSVLASLDELPPEVETMLLGVMDKMVYDVKTFSNSLEKSVYTMQQAGTSPKIIKQTLANDMGTGGRIFGQLRNDTKASIVDGINQSAKMGQYKNYDLDKGEFAWVAVGGHKVCMDCDARAGQKMTFAGWEAEGLPGSGWSVCQGFCYCVLDPTGKASKKIDAPVKEPGAKKVKFQNAVSIKEAEKWATNNIKGVRSANYGNMPIHRVNTINQELLLLQNKYGKLGNLDEIKAVKTNKFSGKMQNGHRLLIDNNTTNSYWKRESLAGIHPGKPSISGLIDHEIGHALTPSVWNFDTGTGVMTSFGKRLDVFFNANRNKIINEISEYAGSARHEFVAEAFAMREAKKAPKWALDYLKSEGL